MRSMNLDFRHLGSRNLSPEPLLHRRPRFRSSVSAQFPNLPLFLYIPASFAINELCLRIPRIVSPYPSITPPRGRRHIPRTIVGKFMVGLRCDSSHFSNPT